MNRFWYFVLGSAFCALTLFIFQGVRSYREAREIAQDQQYIREVVASWEEGQKVWNDWTAELSEIVFEQKCVCGQEMKITQPASPDGYAYKCATCGRWYAWAWTDPLKELKFSGD